MTANDLRVTLARLASVQRDCDLVDRRREELRLQRNDLLRKAIAQGGTHAQVSKAIGRSRGRIGQIAKT